VKTAETASLLLFQLTTITKLDTESISEYIMRIQNIGIKIDAQREKGENKIEERMMKQFIINGLMKNPKWVESARNYLRQENFGDWSVAVLQQKLVSEENGERVRMVMEDTDKKCDEKGLAVYAHSNRRQQEGNRHSDRRHTKSNSKTALSSNTNNHNNDEDNDHEDSDDDKFIICRHYYKTGKCSYGSSCRFRHLTRKQVKIASSTTGEGVFTAVHHDDDEEDLSM
jgi:hypothetical protein